MLDLATIPELGMQRKQPNDFFAAPKPALGDKNAPSTNSYQDIGFACGEALDLLRAAAHCNP